MLGKLCTGALSEVTRQLLVGNRNRAQWQTYRCEECNLQVGVRQDRGRWVPEEHWLSVSYSPRIPKTDPRRSGNRPIASHRY